MAKAAVYVTDITTRGNPVDLESLKSVFIPILTPQLAKAIAGNVVSPVLSVYYLDLPDTAEGITAYDVLTTGEQLK